MTIRTTVRPVLPDLSLDNAGQIRGLFPR